MNRSDELFTKTFIENERCINNKQNLSYRNTISASLARLDFVVFAKLRTN